MTLELSVNLGVIGHQEIEKERKHGILLRAKVSAITVNVKPTPCRQAEPCSKASLRLHGRGRGITQGRFFVTDGDFQGQGVSGRHRS